MADRALIIEAFVELAGGDVLTKKPTVKDVESLIGEDVTASERDAAWNEFNITLDVGKPAGNVVTNHYTGPIAINGIEIQRGDSAEVPGFDPSHKLMARWLEHGIITVE